MSAGTFFITREWTQRSKINDFLIGRNTLIPARGKFKAGWQVLFKFKAWQVQRLRVSQCDLVPLWPSNLLSAFGWATFTGTVSLAVSRTSSSTRPTPIHCPLFQEGFSFPEFYETLQLLIFLAWLGSLLYPWPHQSIQRMKCGVG